MSTSTLIAKRIGLSATAATAAVGTLGAASVTPVAAQIAPEPEPPADEGGEQVRECLLGHLRV